MLPTLALLGSLCGQLPAVDPARMELDLRALVAAGTRVEGTPGLAAARRYVQGTLEGLGLRVERDVFRLDHPFAGRSVEVANLRVSFGPRDAAPLVLVAHLDSRGADDPLQAAASGWVWDRDPAPGADDNGSGVAVLLELARNLQAAPPRGRVDLAFTGGEELARLGPDGFLANLGAERLAERYQREGPLPRGAISVDMVLMPQSYGEAFRVYEDGCWGSAELASALEWAARRQAPAATFRRLLDPSFTWSDHGAFWAIGAPAVLLIEDHLHHPGYHRPQDTLERGSVGQMVTATRILLDALAQLDR